jgi:hypothetical protein
MVKLRKILCQGDCIRCYSKLTKAIITDKGSIRLQKFVCYARHKLYIYSQ